MHSGQKTETTQMSTNRWMDKQNVLHTYNEMYYSDIKRNRILTYTTIQMKTENYDAKWNKPDTKG